MRREWLKPFLTYISKVYGIKEKVKRVDEPRKQPQISSSSSFLVLLMGAVFRMKSMNQLNGWILMRRFKRLVPRGTRLPFQDTLRRILKSWSIHFLTRIHESIIRKVARNGVFRGGTIKGWKVAAIDGVELFESTKKCCPNCLTRVRDGVTHYFHSVVACLTVGSDPHLLLGVEFLRPAKKGPSKNEGELTGAKRLFERLYQSFHHFADIIVVDALYCNVPFLEMIVSHGMHAVVRLKKEELTIMQDAKGLFSHRDANESWMVQKKGKEIEVKVWKDSKFRWGDLDQPLSVYRFIETIRPSSSVHGKPQQNEIWVVTTLDSSVKSEIVWKIIHKRWDIENNGFRELKTKWNIDHCFIHDPNAIEAFFIIQMMAFNLFQLFLFRRLHHFRDSGLTQEWVVEYMRTEAHMKTTLFYMLDPPYP